MADWTLFWLLILGCMVVIEAFVIWALERERQREHRRADAWWLRYRELRDAALGDPEPDVSSRPTDGAPVKSSD